MSNMLGEKGILSAQFRWRKKICFLSSDCNEVVAQNIALLAAQKTCLNIIETVEGMVQELY